MNPVLVLGKSGQVATALAGLGSIAGRPVICIGRDEADICDARAVDEAFEAHRPALAVNAAAYTAVDAAESAPDEAHAVNADGAGHLAQACAGQGIPLIHLSTDYVFDGRGERPYREDDPVAPLGVYGRSKLAGEELIRARFDRHLILRTSWVFSASGGNFVTTMLRLGAERDELGIVDDQKGTPTFAGDIAAAISALAEQILSAGDEAAWGTYHMSNAGHTTWYGFAREIFACAEAAGREVPSVVKPITTEDYPTPATRPRYSILDTTKLRTTFGIELPTWQDALARCLA